MPYNRTAGGALTQDFINAALLNDYDAPHQLPASGALDPHTPGRYVITKATAAALTLGAPVAGAEDGLELQITSSTAAAHTLTATGLLQTGSANVNVATWAAQPGASLNLIAFNGKWMAAAQIGITFS